MKQYATLDAQEYIYMDCLYIKQFVRGLGIGKQLIQSIQNDAKKLGCKQLQWQTPNQNKNAIRFYKQMGGISKSKQRFFLKQSS
jgi:GNAT superfamily N-acetyltransferase